MPTYQSLTGRDVIIKLGKNKQEVKITTTPIPLPYENLQILFPKHIKKIDGQIKREDLDKIVQLEMIRQNPQSFKEQFLKNSLPTGSWSGQRCFIVGGGPSLKGFNFSKLCGEKIIAINKAFVDLPFADITFAVDRQYQDWLIKGTFNMFEASKLWPNFKGHKVWLKIPGEIYQAGIEFVPLAGHEGISTSLEEGIYDGSNSGYSALNLAIALGANPIYLLGYDMKKDNRGDSHYHSGYPHPQKKKELSTFAKKFPQLAKLANEKNIKIINLNKDSELKCFEFGTIKEALLPISKPHHNYVIVSFYTPEYTEDILRLTNSVEKFGLPYDFELLKNLPLEGPEKYKNWSKNAYLKAEFIKRMMDKYPSMNIIWIDADAVIQQYPALFDKMNNCDIGVYYKDNKELLTGTLYLTNNDTTRKIVDEWIAENEKSKYFLEQKVLENVINKNKNLKIYNLPSAYCKIFDNLTETTNPVIEHFQSSRKWRKSETKMKKISVIMPTYNQSKFIQESIDSVINQTFGNWELIIVDDGSTDDTWITILANQFAYPDKIKIIQKGNGGTGSALNLGFAQATGEYETWLASDNKYYPNALQDMYDVLEAKKDVDFVYCNCEIGVMDCVGLEEIQRKNYNSEISMEWDSYKYYDHHNTGIVWLWRKELRISAGKDFITEPCEDFEMTIRMIETGGQFYYHPIVSGWHRRHDANLTKKLLGSGQYIQNLIKQMKQRRDNKPRSELIFTNIYQGNKWNGKESKSGNGSSLDATKKIRTNLPNLFKKFNIKTITDAACGDWNWMKTFINEIEFDSYTGLDIVKDIIFKNTNLYSNNKITFNQINLTTQPLNIKSDVIFCRDMLNHLSNFDIIETLKNFILSDSTYVLMTNFTKDRLNKDIATGAWRTINFKNKPFNFSNPLAVINEDCKETDTTGTYEDKELALWKLDDIAKMIFEKTSDPIHKKMVIDKAVHSMIKAQNQTPKPIEKANLEKWCLEKIPKKIFFYWGAEVLPFLHFMTVKSFIKYNPDWKVVIYLPKEVSLEKPWSGWEHKYKLNCPDYLDELLKLPLELRYFDARCLNLSNKCPEIIKSDFLRWHLLGTEGGVWADMDIIFTSSMNKLRFNYEKNKDIDTVVAICEDYLPEYMFHTIGFMMSAGNNPYYNYIVDKSKKNDSNYLDYEIVGNKLLNQEFQNVKKILTRFPSLKIENIPFDTLYMYYPLKRIPELFNSSGIERRTDNSIGVHWYAGHFCVEKFVNEITALNYQNYSYSPIGCLIQEVIE